jgi:hypothetical protein
MEVEIFLLNNETYLQIFSHIHGSSSHSICDKIFILNFTIATVESMVCACLESFISATIKLVQI